MRKILILIVFLAVINLFSLIKAESYINASLGFDLKLGYNIVDFSNFGESYANIFKYGFGLNKEATSINALFIKGGNIKYFLIKNFALNLKTDFIVIENRDILHDEILDKDTIESNLSLNALYIGIGPKYYLGLDFLKGIFPYINIDAGFLMLIGSTWEVKVKPEASYYIDAYKEQITTLNGSGFSASIEIGTEIYFSGIGLNIGGGYRYANLETIYEKIGIFKIKELSFDTINLSGAYVNSGILFYFGNYDASNVVSYTIVPSAEEKYGDYYYSKKDYIKALFYYNEAVKKSVTRAIYKKLGLTHYRMGQKQEAKIAFEKYLSDNPDDIQIKDWIENIK